MNIAAINYSHNASMCYIEDGEIVFYIEEERLSRKKYDDFVWHCFHKLKQHTTKLDHFGLVGLTPKSNYNRIREALGIEVDEVHDLSSKHHFCHAACGFYNSGFDEALCIIVDGGGSVKKTHQSLITSEKETIYHFKYPCKSWVIFQELQMPSKAQSMSVGIAFEQVAHQCGWSKHDAGKVMGLAAYGQYNPQLPPVFADFDGKWQKNYACEIRRLELKDHQQMADLCWSVQTTTKMRVIQLIEMALEKDITKNIVLTGGYALNCVNNYEYLKLFPDMNLYIEPVSHDGGTAIGAAKWIWHKDTLDLTKRPLKSLYLG